MPVQSDSPAGAPARVRAPGNRLARLHGTLAQTIDTAGRTLDRHPGWCIVFLLLCVLVPATLKARYTLFTCDEVYTLRIAQQPTLRQMLDVSRRIDLHPPLHYLAERTALATPLPRWLGARLPSLLATVGTFLLCWAFVRRSAGNLAGLAAACVLWFTPALPFAWLNRPYALWLFFLALLAVCWQRTREPGASRWWTLGVFLATAGMILDYMAGLLCVLPFLAAGVLPVLPPRPLVRHAQQPTARTMPWPTTLALLAPCLVGFLYIRQLHDFAGNSFAPQYLDWAGVTLDSYTGLLLIPCGVLAACLAATWLITSRSFSPSVLPSTARTAGLNSQAVVVGFGLLCLPLLFAVLAALRHTQFFTRYAACGAIGVALLAGTCLPRLTRHLPTAAALLALSLVIAAALLCQDAPFNPTGPWRAEAVPGVAPLQLSQLDPTTPLVVARAVGYTEMNEREPASLLDHTYYLYDRAAAQQFSGSTIFETIATTADLLHYQTRTAPLQPFLAQHRSFYLIADYTHPEEWLPRYLQAHGAHLRYLGKFSSTYEDDDLHFVTLP